MKALLIAGTVITEKEQALNLVRKLNKYFKDDISPAMAAVTDDYTEWLVNAGFITWDEAEQAAF